jgi:hypothetical protein
MRVKPENLDPASQATHAAQGRRSTVAGQHQWEASNLGGFRDATCERRAQFKRRRNLRRAEVWWEIDGANRYLMALFLEAPGQP